MSPLGGPPSLSVCVSVCLSVSLPWSFPTLGSLLSRRSAFLPPGRFPFSKASAPVGGTSYLGDKDDQQPMSLRPSDVNPLSSHRLCAAGTVGAPMPAS